MKCFNCGVTISNVDKYCPRCGALFNNGDVERYGDTLENQLLNIYISKKKINCNFSLGYLLFNFVYALYKKMYFVAIFGILSNGLFIFMILNWKRLLLGSIGFYALFIMFSIMIGIVVNIYYILKFDELHISRTKSYINKIIRENGEKNVRLLENLCEKDSKGNIWVPIVVSIGMVVIIWLLLKYSI